MRSSYKRMGDYIRKVDNRNKDVLVTDPVFEIVDHNKVHPEYLMMWMRRSEFDRYVFFRCDSAIRGGFGWEELCDVALPVPTIEKQREIVREYYTIVDRIKLNEQLNQKLEETAQAIYKQWFVDFEFPMSKEHAAKIGKPELEGKPYKSSGGKMVWNDELDQEIPEGWENGTVESFSELIDGDRGKSYPSQGDFFEEGHCLFLNTGNVTKSGFDFSSTSFITAEKNNALRKGKLKRYDSVLTTCGTVGNCAYFSDEVEYDHLRINSGMIIIRSLDVAKYKVFNYQLLKSPMMKNAISSFLSGSAQPQLPIKDIRRINILKPVDAYIEKSMELIEPLQKNIDGNNKNIRKSKELLSLLLSKMTKAEAIA
ncbi:restriction endonuclease subunit S [Fastidiosibacter lacustris]|uniref:restriction endonuclease subunit S n=1 Tax=Fastidiosibacter lacustris TaxID=2056695 RepID=UPI000E351255|nr:restriction endonuclease subunit S [Fastidiosibacter lacustris]